MGGVKCLWQQAGRVGSGCGGRKLRPLCPRMQQNYNLCGFNSHWVPHGPRCVRVRVYVCVVSVWVCEWVSVCVCVCVHMSVPPSKRTCCLSLEFEAEQCFLLLLRLKLGECVQIEGTRWGRWRRMRRWGRRGSRRWGRQASTQVLVCLISTLPVATFILMPYHTAMRRRRWRRRGGSRRRRSSRRRRRSRTTTAQLGVTSVWLTESTKRPYRHTHRHILGRRPYDRPPPSVTDSRAFSLSLSLWHSLTRVFPLFFFFGGFVRRRQSSPDNIYMYLFVVLFSVLSRHWVFLRVCGVW